MSILKSFPGSMTQPEEIRLGETSQRDLCQDLCQVETPPPVPLPFASLQMAEADGCGRGQKSSGTGP